MPEPDYPEQVNLEFAGGLDDKTFENLQNKGIIGDQYHYYSDFRWYVTVIEQLCTLANQEKFKKDTDLKKLNKLLNSATNKAIGLIAYCD